MAGSSGADAAVVRSFSLAAGVAYSTVEEAFVGPVFSVEFFETPETTASEDCTLGGVWEVRGGEGVRDVWTGDGCAEGSEETCEELWHLEGHDEECKC